MDSQIVVMSAEISTSVAALVTYAYLSAVRSFQGRPVMLYATRVESERKYLDGLAQHDEQAYYLMNVLIETCKESGHLAAQGRIGYPYYMSVMEKRREARARLIERLESIVL